MSTAQPPLPKWILIISGLFALMELGVSISLFLAPDTIADKVDLAAKGVNFLIMMWASRQFALGCIFAYAVFRRSVPMLTLAYIFFGVMMVCDLMIGVVQKDNALLAGSLVFSVIIAAMLYMLNRKKQASG